MRYIILLAVFVSCQALKAQKIDTTDYVFNMPVDFGFFGQLHGTICIDSFFTTKGDIVTMWWILKCIPCRKHKTGVWYSTKDEKLRIDYHATGKQRERLFACLGDCGTPPIR